MTDRANKDKPRRGLSLSKSKKKGNVSAGTPASAASSMTPITSFFNSQPPSKLACPLCGQLVPRFRINEHIDLQCQNFDRGDSCATSASNNVVPSTQLSPRRNPAKSPELDRNKEEEVKETNTSPYFKKDNCQQAPREINSKTVVRTIALGSLSSKISKKCLDPPERTRTDGEQLEKERDPPETLSSSQKENVLSQNLEDIKDCVKVIDLTETCDETPTAVAHRSCSEKGHNLKQTMKLPKPETSQKLVTPKLHVSSSKLAKRKKTTSTGKVSAFTKKAKFDKSRETDEVMSSEIKADKTDTDQDKTVGPSTTSDPPLSSEEICDLTAALINSDSLPEFAQQTISDQAVESLHPSDLPYYLRNFRTVLEAVLENEDDRALFNQDDMSLVHAFEKLSGTLECHTVIII